MSKNMIGLDTAKTQSLAEGLNDLLANYQVFYMNVRGYHWNIKGDKFFELHVKFEELYDDLLMKIDEVAERILTLGHRPMHTYSAYTNKSAIPERQDVSDGNQCMEYILESFTTILEKQRKLLHESAEADDEGTNSLMSDYITEQEKTVWMYRSFLGK
ncbi:MAG: Dps family protein [Oleiphilaceae bacterium]|nr:Dps family protein [Oleiphilaceae bacterium]